MTKARVLLIDDEADSRFLLRNTLEKNFSDQLEIVGEADGVKSGNEAIRKHQPDLVFLDIKMRDGSGFDLLTSLNEITFEIIFVTAYDNYAIKAFQFSAFGYLMKPIKSSELTNLIESFQKKKIKAEQNEKRIKVLIENYGDERKVMKLVISNMEGFKVLEIEDIIRLEGDSNYTHFILNGNKRETASKNLGVYEELLNQYGFFRAHQSTIINLRHVKGYLKINDQVEMSDGEMIKLSRYRKSEFVKRFV